LTSTSWVAANACLQSVATDPTLQALCPQASVTPGDIVVTGTLVVDSDNVWTNTVAGSVTAAVHVPSACLALSPFFSLGCADIEGQLGIGATCLPADGGDCSCVITTDVSDASTGTLVTDAGVATVNGTDTYGYCVAGDVLRYREFDNLGTPHTVVVLSRQ
jgi:hypothetical protein